MKEKKTSKKRIAPAVESCLKAVAALNANSSNCFFIYQPKAPAALDKFKKIK